MELRAKWLADLCAERGLKRVVEVGVHRGHFSRWLLEANPAIYLIGVDPYAPYPENTTDRTRDREEAQANYAAFPGRCALWLCTSETAAAMAGAADLVYIDGAHDTHSVTVDCESWWPLLPRGGILAGHDYNHQPVAAAVLSFAFRHRLQVQTFEAIELEGITRTSWWIVR